jgi:hypothetical protein
MQHFFYSNRNERTLIALCIEIAKGDIGGDRFNQLLVEAGVYLYDVEWEFANRLLGRSDRLMSLAAEGAAAMQ